MRITFGEAKVQMTHKEHWAIMLGIGTVIGFLCTIKMIGFLSAATWFLTGALGIYFVVYLVICVFKPKK